jgi:hypothetical protein
LIKLLLSGKQLLLFIIITWGLLAFVSYNVLTVEASTDKEIQKQMCIENYEADWKDGKCEFSGKDKNFEREHEFDLADKGVYDSYSERNNLKEKYLKQLVNDEDSISRDNADYFCDALEDYEENKKACDKLYDKVEQQEAATATEKAAQEEAEPREWYYNENTGSYEYMTDKEIKEHNLESETGIRYGDRWGPEDGKEIIPPKEPYPTTNIEDWSNTVSEPKEYHIDQGVGNVITEVSKDEYDEVNEQEEEEPDTSSEEATEQEEESDNTDSSDSQDSSDNEDNSSDDGGDSSDSGDDSSSSDDGGDSGDSSESEE